MGKKLVFAVLMLSLLSCGESNEPAKDPVKFALKAPENLGGEVPFPARNPFSKKKIELGRMLFYDPILSGSNRISCASCHVQQLAFSDGQTLSSFGATGNELIRHTPALINNAWMTGLFWEGGAKDLESLAFGPITDPSEMDQNLAELEQELNDHQDYPFLFREAFKVSEISRTEIVRALAQFQRSLISANSRYDKYVRKEEGGQLDDKELKGLGIYKAYCSSCHATDLFTDNLYHNNGIDDDFSNVDHELVYLGRFRISFDSSDIGAFKTPTLRNIMITAPYMHDGRFADIDAVLDHYSHGIKSSPYLDPVLKNLKPTLKDKLDQEEKDNLKAFLHTLTDQEFLTDPALADPFIQ